MLSVITLSVGMLNFESFFCCAKCRYAKCHYAECHYSKYRYAECRCAEFRKVIYCCAGCHYAECRYSKYCCAECRYAEFRKVSFFVVLSVVMLSVMGPNCPLMPCSQTN
jgi:hypothetical protein